MSFPSGWILYSILNTPAFTSAICHRRSTKKKRWYQKNGLGATSEFFSLKGYGVFCCFSYESFLSLFVWVSLGWSGIDFYILVTFFPAFSYRLLCVCFYAVSCCLYLCKVCLGLPIYSLIPSLFSPQVLSPGKNML